MKSIYLNTDVDIDSSEDLTALIDFLDGRTNLLYGDKVENGKWHISLEAIDSCIADDPLRSPNIHINELIEVLREGKLRFPKEFKSVSKFDFNVGWQSAAERPEGAFTLESELLFAISELGASLTVTIYPSNDNDF